MKKLSSRIKRRIGMICTNFKSDCHFSVYFALLRIVDDVGLRLGFNKISDVAHKAKDKWIIEYLQGCIQPVIMQFRNNSDKGVCEANSPIWVCWWDSELDAPELVRQCIKSIIKHAGNHPVHVVDKNTYNQYLHIPDDILKKAETGQIKLAHLSDYIRVSLIAQYGGLWLDATVFCAYEISEEYFKQSIFTCKSEPQKSRFISQMRWTTFVLGGWKGNVLYMFLKLAFEIYWKEENMAIDYLFFDYLIELARKNVPAVRQYMDEIPLNNLRRDDLQAAMGLAVSGKKFEDIVQQDTILYKLSWRESFQMKTVDGDESIYAFFLKKEI